MPTLELRSEARLRRLHLCEQRRLSPLHLIQFCTLFLGSRRHSYRSSVPEVLSKRGASSLYWLTASGATFEQLPVVPALRAEVGSQTTELISYDVS
jgi:hypothetical protein